MDTDQPASSASDIPPTMKAQVLRDFNTDPPYELVTDFPTPILSDPRDLLVKVTAASYCHTDHVLASGGMKPNPLSFPHVGCHEFAGVVAAVPPRQPVVSTSPNSPAANPYKIGDRVGIPGRAYHPCGECEDCVNSTNEFAPTEGHVEDERGYSVYCPEAGNHGISRAGGFQEYALVDARQVARIPESMTDVDTSALMCAGVTIYNALEAAVHVWPPTGHKDPGHTSVGIIGCGGGLGHLGLQFAMAMGFKTVVGVDNADRPLALARSVVDAYSQTLLDIKARGSDNPVAGSLPSQVSIIDSREEAVDYKKRLDSVIILAESQAAFDYGAGLAKNYGRIVVVSFPPTIKISSNDLVFRGVKVVGSLVGGNKTTREMLKVASDFGVRPRVRTFALKDLNALVHEYHKGEGGKLVVDMSLSG